jgi:transcriptional regulator with XRE-family HTH domain
MILQQVFMGNMKKYRKQAGITQEKLAELCETDPCYIGQLETGRRCPSLALIEKIAASLNIPPYLLFYDASTAPPEAREQLFAIQKDAFTSTLIDNVSERIRTLADQYL